MIVYTAEDFEQAMFAVHPDPDAVDARYAARMNRDPEFPWLLDGVLGNGDEHMARDGWVPVRVANGRRDRDTYIDHIADQDRVIRRRNEEIAALRRELADAQAPLSLDSLAAAWEAAEVADECREGDVLIIRDDEDNYLVRRMCDRSYLDSTARILSRAPKPREPWQDLADVIGEHTYEPDPKWLAQALYQSGVRVTDGGE